MKQPVDHGLPQHRLDLLMFKAQWELTTHEYLDSIFYQFYLAKYVPVVFVVNVVIEHMFAIGVLWYSATVVMAMVGTW